MNEASNEEVLEKLRQIVLSDTPFGFSVFYSVMSNQILPAHCAWWIDEMYFAEEHGMGFANEAFRGSLKTTIITNYFTAYRMGLYPKRSNLFAQANNDKATMNSKFVADLVANSNEWKLFFPSIRPDEDMGWGAKGHFVQRIDMDYGKFRRGADKDPSLIGAGYKSSDILGMHPTGLLIVDDINDLKNTRSKRELDAVVGKWEAEIRPAAIIGETFEIYNFTPWVPGDVGDIIKKENNVHHIQTPICWDRDINKPIWPEKFTTKLLKLLRDERHSPAEWARMFLLDLEAMKGRILQREWLHWYPHTDIKEEWPVVIGVDYASVEDVQEKKGRDQFALAVLKKVPGGGLILVDGIRAHLTQGQAEDEVVAWNDLYGSRCHLIGVEALGGGLTFYGSLLRMAKLPLRRSTVGNKSKGIRFEKGLGPLFRRGRIYISDAPDNKFVDEFIDEWVSWSGDGDKDPNDILDAVFHAIECARGNILKDEHSDIEMPEIDKKSRNPMLAFARR